MKEIREIIAAYDKAVAQQKKSALATVVHVEGSSYRRPGARMLVTDDGFITGAISGGCLEGDALRKALLAIHQDKNKLVTYDTTDDDAAFGVQLGCNGIVHILFEPLHNRNINAIDLLKSIQQTRSVGIIATLFSLNKEVDQPGTVLAQIGDSDPVLVPSAPGDIRNILSANVSEAFASRQTQVTPVWVNDIQYEASIQVVAPAISIAIFGAGNDTIPLADMASLLGWMVTVADGRPGHANAGRFKSADQIIVAKPIDAVQQMSFDQLSAAVLMTHNYNYDMDVLEHLLETKCRYIGILGPAKKFARMMDDLKQRFKEKDKPESLLTDAVATRIYAPVGIDVGAETSEEIALSVAAEIKAVLADASAEFLKNRQGPIHKRASNSEPQLYTL